MLELMTCPDKTILFSLDLPFFVNFFWYQASMYSKRFIYGACKWKKKKGERKEEKKGDQDRISPYNYQMNTISSSQVMRIKNKE